VWPDYYKHLSHALFGESERYSLVEPGITLGQDDQNVKRARSEHDLQLMDDTLKVDDGKETRRNGSA
jgi:hypothetical protein